MKKANRKHKSGERGLLEEKDNVSKRCNMADTVAPIQPELSLLDIKEILVDIQIAVATILRENQELKQEILELKSALNANQRETEKLQTQLTKAEKVNDTLRNELNHTKSELKDQIEETNKLDETYHDLELYSSSSYTLGIPEGVHTSNDEVAIRIGEAI